MPWTGPLLCPSAVSGSSISIGSFATVQAAFNALDTVGAGGGRIAILELSSSATYTITTALSLANKNNWKIVGNNSTIFAAAGTISLTGRDMCNLSNCNDWVVDSLHFNGNYPNRTGNTAAHNWDVRETNRGAFVNCTSYNVPGGDGWLLGTFAPHLDLSKIPTDMLWFGCEAYNCGRNGISIIQGRHVEIRGGSLHDQSRNDPQAGIDFEPDMNLSATATLSGNVVSRYNHIDNFLVEGCDIYNNDGTGVSTVSKHTVSALTLGVYTANGTITGNRFSRNSLAPPAAVRGSAVQVGGPGITVEQNDFNSLSAAGVRAVINIQTDGAVSMSGVSINGNYFNRCSASSAAIYCTNASGPGPTTISNNIGFNALPTLVVVQTGATGVTTSNNSTTAAESHADGPPPITTDLGHCTVGLGTRKTVYVGSLGRQTVANQPAYQTALRLAHTPGPSESWIYLTSALVDNDMSVTAASSLARSYHETNATENAQMAWAPSAAGSGTDAVPYASIFRATYGVTPSTQNIALQIATEAGNTCGVSQACIAGFQQSSDDQITTDNVTETTSITGFTTKISQTVSLSGNYLFALFAEVAPTSSRSITVRGDQGGTKYGSATITVSPNSAIQWLPWLTMFYKTGLSGSTTTLIEFASSVAGGDVQIRRGRIFALKDVFKATYQNSAKARNATTAATDQDDIIITSIMNSGLHLVLADMVLDGDTNGYAGSLEQDGVELAGMTEHPQSTTDNGVFFALRQTALTAGSHTFKTLFRSLVAGNTTGASEAFLGIFDLGTKILTVGLDSILTRTAGTSLTTGLDAALQNSLTRDLGLHAVLQGTVTKSVNLNAVLLAIGSVAKTAQFDSVLVKAMTLATGLDARLSKAILLSFDGIMSRSLSLTVGLDAIFNSNRQTVTTGLDALVVRQWVQHTGATDIWTTIVPALN